MDAVLSPWHALVVRARVQPGETVVGVGGGGLGLNGIQVAIAQGARVAVIEPVQQRREAALEVGAEVAVEPSFEEQIRDWADGGVDVAYEAVGAVEAFEATLRTIRPGGRIVCCGYGVGTRYAFESSQLVLHEVTVLGSRAGGREDAHSALAVVEAGVIVPQIGVRLALDRVNEALSMLREGGFVGRIVLVPEES